LVNNWHGQLDWLSKLDWIGQVEYNGVKDKDWYSYVSGQKAGTMKSFLNLAFVKVLNAGQYVSYCKLSIYRYNHVTYLNFLYTHKISRPSSTK
jgi:carboxypeptidase C (cathepsin A)